MPDMSIRFGNGHWVGYQSELISGKMVPVCSRAFCACTGI